MGSGGSSGGGGSGWQTSTSTPQLYNWQQILPPWVSSAQQQTVPWLQHRAQTGLLPGEERTLWGGAREQIEQGSMGAGRNLSRQIAASGMSPTSPMVAGGFADLQSNKLADTAKAAMDFAKLKLGAKDTAIGQLMTALYTPPPVAVGNTAQSFGRSSQTAPGGK